jgi:hypothetical protein
MMEKFFCSEASRQAGEDIIGSASGHQTYILIECRTPWEHEAFDSKYVPENLRQLGKEAIDSKMPVRFLLISSSGRDRQTTDSTKVIIYDKDTQPLAWGYKKQEFNVGSIENVAPVVRSYLAGEEPNCERETRQTQDILVCTHGSHDQCCARYGNPFYAKAKAMVNELGLDEVRVWKSSHFGGHRFAPTAITFPDGRYYGGLDIESFQTILTRIGEIECLKKVYRGWGMLPSPMQVLERELILLYGWDWFNYKASGKILEQTMDKSYVKAEIMFEKSDGFIYTYEADLIKDECKTICVKASCGAAKDSTFTKYAVENLRRVAVQAVCLSV